MSETRLRKYPQSKGKQQIRLKVKNILETAWESGREIIKLTPSRVSCVGPNKKPAIWHSEREH